MVQYSTNVELLKPEDMARGNRILFFEVNNRGNKLALGVHDDKVAGIAAARPCHGQNAFAFSYLARAGDDWRL